MCAGSSLFLICWFCLSLAVILSQIPMYRLGGHIYSTLFVTQKTQAEGILPYRFLYKTHRLPDLGLWPVPWRSIGQHAAEQFLTWVRCPGVNYFID